MSLRVYNTLTREKELFQPVQPGKVGIYVCGPTVYKSPHIGHMVGPVIFDAVKRYLQYKGYEVTWVVNITDVDDKLIAAANKLGTTIEDLARKHTREYLDCLAALGIDTIDRFPKASDHMAEIIDICKGLIDKGAAYAVDGNVWFDVTRDADYGKLSKRKVEEQESGTRDLEGAGKRHPADFALWKAAKTGEPAWDSPWGKGRPGWHIECSAMSMKYLGPTFDVHGGGMDLMFPHHENELAQSETATDRPFVRYWMHNGLTRVKTKSKSGEWQQEDMHETTGNVVRARQLIDELGADLFRYFILSTHYRRPIDFEDDVIAAAKKGFNTFLRLLERVERLTGQPLPEKGDDMDRAANGLLDGPHADFARNVLAYKMKFLEAMDDDFNTAGAIGVMHELAGEVNSFVERTGAEKAAERDKRPELATAVTAAAMTLRNLLSVLGMFRVRVPRAAGADTGLADELMALLIQLRNDARKNKNFALADAVRDGLKKIGVTLEDRAEGTTWRKE